MEEHSGNGILWQTIVAAFVMLVAVCAGVYFLQSKFGDGNTPNYSAPNHRVFGSSDFESSIRGMSKKEVIALLGQPIAVNSGIDPGTQNYDYSPAESYLGEVSFRVIDDVTGSEQRNVTIGFDAAGHVDNIWY